MNLPLTWVGLGSGSVRVRVRVRVTVRVRVRARARARASLSLSRALSVDRVRASDVGAVAVVLRAHIEQRHLAGVRRWLSRSANRQGLGVGFRAAPTARG